MGQPYKFSDELFDEARAVVPFSQRIVAGQIKFWAGLGKSIEPLLRDGRSMSLQRSGYPCGSPRVADFRNKKIPK